jgi:hypothetical protein
VAARCMLENAGIGVADARRTLAHDPPSWNRPNPPLVKALCSSPAIGAVIVWRMPSG